MSLGCASEMFIRATPLLKKKKKIKEKKKKVLNKSVGMVGEYDVLLILSTHFSRPSQGLSLSCLVWCGMTMYCFCGNVICILHFNSGGLTI